MKLRISVCRFYFIQYSLRLKKKLTTPEQIMHHILVCRDSALLKFDERALKYLKKDELEGSMEGQNLTSNDHTIRLPTASASTDLSSFKLNNIRVPSALIIKCLCTTYHSLRGEFCCNHSLQYHLNPTNIRGTYNSTFQLDSYLNCPLGITIQFLCLQYTLMIYKIESRITNCQCCPTKQYPHGSGAVFDHL